MNTTLIDVREPDEFIAGHAIGAINVPLSGLPNSAMLKDLPKDTPLVLYCNSGNRSDMAINFLQNKGYTNLTNGINQQQVEQMS